MARGTEVRWNSAFSEAEYHLEYFPFVPSFYEEVCCLMLAAMHFFVFLGCKDFPQQQHL